MQVLPITVEIRSRGDEWELDVVKQIDAVQRSLDAAE